MEGSSLRQPGVKCWEDGQEEEGYGEKYVASF